MIKAIKALLHTVLWVGMGLSIHYSSAYAVFPVAAVFDTVGVDSSKEFTMVPIGTNAKPLVYGNANQGRFATGKIDSKFFICDLTYLTFFNDSCRVKWYAQSDTNPRQVIYRDKDIVFWPGRIDSLKIQKLGGGKSAWQIAMFGTYFWR